MNGASMSKVQTWHNQTCQRQELKKMGIDLQQKQREEARWRILRVLDAARPFGCSETIVWRILHDVKLPLTLMEVRRELAYLRDLVLLEIFDEATELWAARL